MKKKGFLVPVIAVLAGIAGIAVAVMAFMKKRGRTLRDDLDYDESIYLEDEYDLDEDYDMEDDQKEKPSSIGVDVDDEHNAKWEQAAEDIDQKTEK